MKYSETAAKKDTQKLQRAIVDGLEDVKAQDIQVYDTEHLSALFERVIIASGTSNRQTKALASSVVDAVRDAGFAKPRVEGAENGEWIIVDCGAAVAHIMQPTIRQYYHLEEIWGDKPVRLKLGAPKPVEAAKPAPVAATKSKGKAKPDLGPSLRRSSAVKTAERDAKQAAEREEALKSTRKPAAKRTSTKTAGSKSTVQAAAKTALPAAARKAAAKTAVKTPASKTATKPAIKVVGKPAAKKPAAKRPAAKKAAPKKA